MPKIPWNGRKNFLNGQMDQDKKKRKTLQILINL